MAYGDFAKLCRDTPSLAVCNVFFVRLLTEGRITWLGLPLTDNLTNSPLFNASSDVNMLDRRGPEVQSVIARAGVGVNSACAIPKAGFDGSGGNWPLAIVGLFCFMLSCRLWWRSNKRIAAVGRSEMMIFLGTYAGTLPFGVFASASLLPQASAPLLFSTAIQAGFLNALYGTLLQCAIVETQVVEDGTIASLLPTWVFWFINFASASISYLDTGFGWTKILTHGKPLNEDLKNLGLYTSAFLLPCIWMIVTAILKVYVSAVKLGERKPLAFNISAGILWALSQVMTFVLSLPICKSTHARLDGAFLAYAMQTGAVWCMYHAWELQTEATFFDGDISFETGHFEEKRLVKDSFYLPSAKKTNPDQSQKADLEKAADPENVAAEEVFSPIEATWGHTSAASTPTVKMTPRTEEQVKADEDKKEEDASVFVTHDAPPSTPQPVKTDQEMRNPFARYSISPPSQVPIEQYRHARPYGRTSWDRSSSTTTSHLPAYPTPILVYRAENPRGSRQLFP